MRHNSFNLTPFRYYESIYLKFCTESTVIYQISIAETLYYTTGVQWLPHTYLGWIENQNIKKDFISWFDYTKWQYFEIDWKYIKINFTGFFNKVSIKYPNPLQLYCGGWFHFHSSTFVFNSCFLQWYHPNTDLPFTFGFMWNIFAFKISPFFFCQNSSYLRKHNFFLISRYLKISILKIIIRFLTLFLLLTLLQMPSFPPTLPTSNQPSPFLPSGHHHTVVLLF